jgi:hypothetical protein
LENEVKRKVFWDQLAIAYSAEKDALLLVRIRDEDLEAGGFIQSQIILEHDPHENC